MVTRSRALAAWAALLAGALPGLGCSSLTQPDDITIAAEPIAAAPAPAPAPPPVLRPAPGGAGPQAAPASGG